jgi:hypothetical protein
MGFLLLHTEILPDIQQKEIVAQQLAYTAVCFETGFA